MKKILQTRMAIFLVAVGFFYGCATQKGPTYFDFKDQQLFSEAEASISKEIERTPASATLYLERADIHARWAASIPEAQDRRSHYEMMVSDIANALSLSESGQIKTSADSLIDTYWQFEFNQGVLQMDTASEDISLSHGLSNFNNALTINPGKIEAYQTKAKTHYRMGNPDLALQSLIEAESLGLDLPHKVYEEIAFLHLEKGNALTAIAYFELAEIDVQNNKNAAFGLVNAYLAQNDIDRALTLLSELVEVDSENAQLRNVYGTQLYFLTLELFPRIEQAFETGDNDSADELLMELEASAGFAESELQEAYSLASNNMDYVESLAIFYNNLTAAYFELADKATGEDAEFLKTRGFELAELALRFYSEIKESGFASIEIDKKISILNKLLENR